MKKAIIILILIISMITINTKISSAIIRINEIMYNPSGEDNNNEYVEIYYDENINFSNYVIGDTINNDTLELIKNNNNKNNFILIVEENFNYHNLNCSVYSAGKIIGNGLGNKGDTIFLFDKNNKIINKVTYSNNYANGNGKSLSLVNDFWFEQEPSPCRENFMKGDFINNITNLKNKNNSTDIKIGINIKVKDNTTNDLITSEIVFESRKQRINKFIPYFTIAVLLMISIIFIWKR